MLINMKHLITSCAAAAVLLLPAVGAPAETPAGESKPAESKPQPAVAKAKAPAPRIDYSGRYERASDGKAVFILHVRQVADNAVLDFSASRTDGSGAAPDGHAKATLDEKGNLVGTFEDSFGNKGTVTMTKARAGVSLTVKPETVADSRAVAFYGVISLKRTIDRNR
jgi:hypothetical protein